MVIEVELRFKDGRVETCPVQKVSPSIMVWDEKAPYRRFDRVAPMLTGEHPLIYNEV